MDAFYSLTGVIDKVVVQQAIVTLNQLIWSGEYSGVKFLISSSGGDVDAGITLYTYLKACPLEVHTIGFGQVSSAAVLVFLGGKRRSLTKDCYLIVHEGTYSIALPTAPLHHHEETLRVLKGLLARTTEIISVETGHTKEEIMPIMRDSKKFTDEEAKDFGLCHEVLEKLPLTRQAPIRST